MTTEAQTYEQRLGRSVGPRAVFAHVAEEQAVIERSTNAGLALPPGPVRDAATAFSLITLGMQFVRYAPAWAGPLLDALDADAGGSTDREMIQAMAAYYAYSLTEPQEREQLAARKQAAQ